MADDPPTRRPSMPTTVPFEDPLYWGHTPEQLVAFWQPKLEWLQGCGGNIVVNTHPEPQFSGNATMLRAYAQLLDVLADIRDATRHHVVPPPSDAPVLRRGTDR